MRRFVFELEPVLQLREAEERRLKLDVARIQRERLELEQRLRSHRSMIEGAQLDVRTALAGGGSIPIDRVRASSNNSMATLAQAQATAITLAGTLKRLEHARADLTKAVARRRGIETLKQQRFEAWRRDAERADQAQTDDLVTTRIAIQDDGATP